MNELCLLIVHLLVLVFGFTLCMEIVVRMTIKSGLD